MAFDIEAKILKAKGDRDLAINGIRGTNQLEGELTEQIDFNLGYLFGGPSTEIGILDVFISFYRQANYATGFETSIPALHTLSNYTPWTDQFELAISSSGDGLGGLYPNGDNSKEMNEASTWLTDNGPNNELSLGIVDYLDIVDSPVSAIQAKRVEDLLGTVNPTPPPAEFPDGSPDTPDYFNEPERTNLLNALSGVVTELDALIAYIQDTIDILNSIAAGGSSVFESLSIMKADLPDVAVELTLRNSVESVRAEWQAHYDYFNQFTAADDLTGQTGYVTTEFDTRLLTIGTDKTDTITDLQSLSTNVPAKLGTDSYPFSGMRKWRRFWIHEAIAKPTGPYIIRDGLSRSRAQFQISLENSNETANILLADPSQYMSTPEMITTYVEPVYDIDGNVLATSRMRSIWIGSPGANKYRIFRKEISTVPLNNDEWTDDHLVWLPTLDPDSGLVSIKYYDDTCVLDTGYVYRIQTHDTNLGDIGEDRTDSFNSSSLQTEVFDLDTTVTVAEAVLQDVTGPLVLTLSEEVTASTGSYIALLGGLAQGLYRVLDVSGEVVTIDHDDSADFVGSLVSTVKGGRYFG